MLKGVVVCVQYVVWKNKFLVQFKYGQNRDMSASPLQYLCLKYEVGQEVNDTISDFPKKGQS